MESTARKTTTAATPAPPATQPAAQTAPPVSMGSRSQIQMATRVSSPEDADEKEAEATAAEVMRMAIPDAGVARVNAPGGGVFRQVGSVPEDKRNERSVFRSPYLARFSRIPGLSRQSEQDETPPAGSNEEREPPAVQRKRASPEHEEELQRQVEGTPNLAPNISAEIRSSKSGGNPLPLSVRRFMEPRFQADFRGVRIHTDEQAVRLNHRVQAKAFTVDNHIFFGRGQYRPETEDGRELIAHELTHTIQQGAAVQRMASPHVTQRTGRKVHRLGISDALNYFAGHAHHIPGFRMFTIILGVNPINMSRVDRSAGNILRAIVEFLPGGGLITQALDNHGVFNEVSVWVQQQFNSLAMTGAVIRRAIDRFLDSLSWRDIFDLGGVWQRAKRILTEPIRRIISFGRGLVAGIIRFIKDAILRPLAQLVSRTRGYGLLTAVLGFDPITGDAVPRTPATLIGGFMRLIGQEEVWNNIQRAHAIPRAWAWFQGALGGLMGFVRRIPTLFLNAFRALSIADIVNLPRVLARVIGLFGGVAGQFFSWAGAQVMQLLQIVFEVVAPGAMPFIRRAGAAFRSIIQNPVGFVRNLVRAGRMGFLAFARNFLTHLRASLIGWLTGAMSGAGVHIPQAFTVREILKFILSVLGLTWQNIRLKLVRVLGERTVAALETGFEIVRALVTEGPAAAWQKIVEHVQNLRDIVIEQIMSFVQSRVVQAAVTRLLSMLSPAGAFIQAIIATYNTIMFFVERLRTIIQVGMAFVNSVAAIAAGRIQRAAARVEQTMAGMLTLVISFLARIAGLGRVSDAVTNIINRVRQPIDRALDRVVEWIVAQARRLGRALFGGSGRATEPQAESERERGDGEIGESVTFSAGGEGHRLWVSVQGSGASLMLASNNPGPLTEHLASFRRQAADIADAERRDQVLGWVESASGIARSIEENAREAKGINNPDDPRRRSLDDSIEENERALRPTLSSILAALDVSIPEKVDPPVIVSFAMRGDLDSAEYTRQLAMQQAGINAMVVEEWLANRNRYIQRREFQRGEFEAGRRRTRGSGRDPRSGPAQQALRERTRMALIRRLTQPADFAGPLEAEISGAARAFVQDTFARTIERVRQNGFALSTATRKVDAFMRTQHALHSPDQVAGGRYDDLTGLGAANVNVDIGRNWGGFDKPVHLANRLHTDTINWMTGHHVRRPFWRQVRMNVNLRH